MCIPQGHILYRVQLYSRQVHGVFRWSHFVNGVCQSNKTYCTRLCIWTEVSITNSASIIFVTASLPGVQRWRTVKEVGIFGNATGFDVMIFATIWQTRFVAGRLNGFSTGFSIVYWVNVELKLVGILKTVGECGDPCARLLNVNAEASDCTRSVSEPKRMSYMFLHFVWLIEEDVIGYGSWLVPFQYAIIYIYHIVIVLNNNFLILHEGICRFSIMTKAEFWFKRYAVLFK